MAAQATAHGDSGTPFVTQEVGTAGPSTGSRGDPSVTPQAQADCIQDIWGCLKSAGLSRQSADIIVSSCILIALYITSSLSTFYIEIYTYIFFYIYTAINFLQLSLLELLVCTRRVAKNIAQANIHFSFRLLFCTN